MKKPSKNALMKVFKFWSSGAVLWWLRPSVTLAKYRDWKDTAWWIDTDECRWQKIADVAASCALSDAMLPARWTT